VEYFRLVISNPLPLGTRVNWVDVNPDVTALSWTTGQGGFVGMQIGITSPTQPETAMGLESPVEVPDFADVKVYAGSEDGFCCFRGRVLDVDDNLGQHVTALTAAGYGTADGALGDQWFFVPALPDTTTSGASTSTSATSTTAPKGPDDRDVSAGALLRRMVYQVTSIIRPGDSAEYVDPGGAFTARQQTGRYLGQTVDQLLKTGGDGGNESTFAIWENQHVIMQPLDPPGFPDYRLRANARVQWKRSTRRTIGGVEVQYTPPGGKQSSTGVAFIKGWATDHGGLMRSQLIPGGTMTLQQAIAVRTRYLRRNRNAVRTGTITITPEQPMESVTGEPVPYYAYRYGQWVAIGDESFMITQTSTDTKEGSERTTVTLINTPGAAT
jgi:hypothetical protein